MQTTCTATHASAHFLFRMVEEAEHNGTVTNATVTTMQPSAAKKKGGQKIKKKGGGGGGSGAEAVKWSF